MRIQVSENKHDNVHCEGRGERCPIALIWNCNATQKPKSILETNITHQFKRGH